MLELLDIVGCIITIDAMGCQKEIAASIIAKKADYVLALKGNQGKLEDAVNSWFEEAKSNNFEGVDYIYHHTTQSAHGRIEIRQYWSVPALATRGTTKHGKMVRTSECRNSCVRT